MNKAKLLFLALVLTVIGETVYAQRFTDSLDRGLVAVPTGSSGNSTTNLVSWRRLAEEYYGVTYNLYRDGARIALGLSKTSYNDTSCSNASSYQVAAVVNGVEQTKCDAVKPWTQYVYKLGTNRTSTGFLDIPLAAVYDRNGADVSEHYEPNDAEMADLDGDGQLEIIVKRLNTWDAGTALSANNDKIYPQTNTTEFVVLDAYDVNWQTGAAKLLWRIDCGPNMVSLNSTEIDIVAYDWDEDGRAEVLLRGADNMIVYGPDGKTRLYTIGDMNVNTRNTFSTNDSQYAWTHTGAEYLIYMNGLTGALYQKMDYPLPRLESGESNLKTAWGDDYGHRSSKYFIGAPFLDGRHASLFLGRGIYTRHKFIAMNLDRSSHQWSERWRWNCKTSGSAWYGNGYHNFVIADVDEDGRDEIVYGSMVIDDNGHGLSTTGLGHGDSQNVGDLDPFRRGLEFFGCLEDKPGFNYRNATTGQIYYRHSTGSDDGRSLAANLSNSYPGSMGRSVSSGMLSCVTDQFVSDLQNFVGWGDLNFRIYFDGDLCSEILNSPGTAKEAKVEKPGTGRLFTSSGCNMNNDSKNNPCFQGDIIGDWREEIVLRCGRNLRVYTTGIGTDYAIPTLWHDHQYRQAMVWQMMAYNQAPYTSYFLGEMEGFTVAPPPLTNTGRIEVADGATIGDEHAGQHVLLAATSDATVTVEANASPFILTVNTPTWVQGHDDNQQITTTTYTHTLKGGPFTGKMRLVKQGDGILIFPNATHTFTNPTDVWAGTLVSDGTFTRSAVTLHRFARLESRGGTFSRGITMEYGSELHPGGPDQVGTLSTTSLVMNYGARLVMDVYSCQEADQINLTTRLTIKKVSWQNGPKYLAPVLHIVQHTGGSWPLPSGTYVLGNVKALTGSLSDLVVEGLEGIAYELKYENQQLLLVVGDGQEPAAVCPEPTVAETQLTATDEGILLPTVSLKANSFSLNGKTVTPSLTATFTDLQGRSEEVESSVFYTEDYEQATAVSGWVSGGAQLSIGTDHSRYFLINTGQTNTRYAYTELGVNVGTCKEYLIDFDLAMRTGNTDPIEFCVMSRGGKRPSQSWDNYAAINSNENMLFDLTAQKSTTTYTLNGTSATTNLASDTWYHYSLRVNQEKRTVAWSISNGASGTFALPSGTSTQVDGFYIVAGRYQSLFRLDNVRISTPDLTSYTFDRPGTLTVRAGAEGCRPAATVFDARFVGVEIGASGYATLGCRYPLDLSQSTPVAYVATYSKTYGHVLERVSSAPASTGLLLNAKAGTYRLPITDGETQPIEDNLLVAVTDASGYVVPATDCFVLDSKSSGTGFYRCSAGQIVPAGQSYMMEPSGMPAMNFLDLNGTVFTGLPETRLTIGRQSVFFTPAGLRVQPVRRGLYISQGRKIYLK